MITRLRIFLFRLRALVRARQMDRDLEDEIGSHLAEAAEEYIRQGLSPEEARRAARRSFGGVPQTQEICRQVRSFAWLEELSRDLRYALRTLRKNPAFTVTAAATLALAIGANTVMFSVVDAVLLRPLPYRAPEELAMLWTEDPAINLREGRSALWDVAQWRERSESFVDIATFDSVSTLLTGADGVEQADGASMSPNLLSVLGVQPILGRAFSTDEAGQRQAVILISHRFWQARFGGAPDALGATLIVNGLPSQIVGVLPAGFAIAGVDADLWRPHPARPAVRGGQTWFVVARLRPGVSDGHAQTEMSAIARRLDDELPAEARNQGIAVVPLSLYVVGPQPRLALWLLGAAVFCVFLIAAANVTSLSLARGAARAREMAVRAALGANAGRLVRQLLTESLVLAVLSGSIGTLLAVWGIRLVRAFGPATLPRLNEVSVDLRVLGCAIAIALLSGIVVGLAPAMTALRRDLRPSGEESGRTVSGGSSSRRMRRSLVVAEFALAIVLLVGAGLLVRSWWHVINVDVGFDSERVLLMGISTPPALTVPAERTALYLRVLEEVQAVPGVERAGIIDDLFTGNPRERVITVERNDGAVTERARLTSDEVSPDFFAAMGTPLLRGRVFSATDRIDAPLVAIVNEAMARRSWPRQDPVGRRFTFGARDAGAPWFTVVGVVGDMRRQGPERTALPQVFVSLAQSPASRSVNLLIRTSSDDLLGMGDALREAVRRVDRNAPIVGVAPLEQQLGTYVAQRRFQTSLLTGFSLVALLMAAVGVYGLIQYSIATRTREIGLRMAIGAQRADIFRMVVGEGLALSVTGAVIGLAGAWWLGRAGSSLLFGVAAGDPLTFATVLLLLIAVAAAACYVPARRAMNVDPIRALRVT
ncbi:MAG TPA: ABC transporter permease [Vicinamibacterales bacterium]|nr:ABC transporter permease [Vicinamibacterales bacterium]